MAKEETAGTTMRRGGSTGGSEEEEEEEEQDVAHIMLSGSLPVLSGEASEGVDEGLLLLLEMTSGDTA